jgi:hypothetical protein
MNSDEAEYVSNKINTIKIEYFKYDWTLNGDPPCECSLQQNVE